MLRVSSNIWAKRYDGVNDYDLGGVAPGPVFMQWERTQPWTFFCNLNYTSNVSDNMGLFATGIANAVQGIWVLISPGFGNRVRVFLVNSPANRLVVRATNGLPYGQRVLQITYDGSSTPSGIGIYQDTVLQTNIVEQNNLTASIISTQQGFTIAGNAPSGPTANGRIFRGSIEEVSFVNYVKSVAEMQADFAAGTQSAGTGAYLLKVNPTYNNIITTLDPTTPYLSTDGLGYRINQFGKTNPMILSTDFTPINDLNTLPLYLTRLRRI